MSFDVKGRVALAALLWAVQSVVQGCGGPSRSMQTGTAGIIRLQGNTVADLQVHVFADESGTPRRVAFGISDPQGEFRLIDEDGKGPATLKPGKYRMTIESVAPEPIPIPPHYGDVTKTPLVHEWSATDTRLVIDMN